MPYFALLDDVVSGRAVLFQNLQYSDRILSDGLNHSAERASERPSKKQGHLKRVSDGLHATIRAFSTD